MQNESSPRKKGSLNRRQFLKTASVAAVSPLILQGYASAQERRVRPSNKINLGVVGWGMQGPGNTKSFLY
jgi:hypothetical protein